MRLVPSPRDVRAIVDRSGDAVEQLLAAVPRAVRLVADIEALLAEVASLVGRMEATRVSVDELIGQVRGTVDRTSRLVDALEPSLTTLQPTLQRLADTTAPEEVDALVGLIDDLPQLVLQLERDVLPVLTTLGSVAPDLHDLLDTSKELNGLLAKMPGLGRIRQRVEDRQAGRID